MREWDLRAGGQMLQTICRRRPRGMTPENLSDPGLLGAGEHDAGYRSRLPNVWASAALVYFLRPQPRAILPHRVRGVGCCSAPNEGASGFRSRRYLKRRGPGPGRRSEVCRRPPTSKAKPSASPRTSTQTIGCPAIMRTHVSALIAPAAGLRNCCHRRRGRGEAG